MTESEFHSDLAFLHLSDIHFRKGSLGDVHDIDADLRNELERDLRTIRTNRVTKLDGMIISGDIAFGGQPEEFNYARDWIESVRELLDCPKDGIMTIPGNHDVDRSAIPDGGDVDQMHARIRAAETLPERDSIIAEILRERRSAELLFSSITAYNDFAKSYDCVVTPQMPYWERDFILKDGTSLRIRGATSTLISGPRDHVQSHKVVYGGAQRTLMRQEKMTRIFVGHHPPSWTLEGDDADKMFSDRSVLQLFGHKHDQWFTKIGDSVRLIAGAVQPDRSESAWEPRYSLIALKSNGVGRLQVRIFPRRWSREETTFIGDYNSQGRDYRDHEINI